MILRTIIAILSKFLPSSYGRVKLFWTWQHRGSFQQTQILHFHVCVIKCTFPCALTLLEQAEERCQAFIPLLPLCNHPLWIELALITNSSVTITPVLTDRVKNENFELKSRTIYTLFPLPKSKLIGISHTSVIAKYTNEMLHYAHCFQQNLSDQDSAVFPHQF